MFGAPLVYEYRLGHFSGPWSDEQRALSEAVMTYWTNFAKSGYLSDGPPVTGDSYKRPPVTDLYWPSAQRGVGAWLKGRTEHGDIISQLNVFLLFDCFLVEAKLFTIHEC